MISMILSLLALATAFLTSAAPCPQTTGSAPITPLTTTITYYQGTTTGSSCASQLVASGNLTENWCMTFRTYAATITHLEDRDCTFVLYKGSASCSTEGGEVEHVGLPAGNDTTCVVGDVLDGGMNQKASGMWSCG
nr:hypothetical protein B0A51_15852 [Rachicladosporium sp. CCFEE 5018]